MFFAVLLTPMFFTGSTPSTWVKRYR